jgi:hypothetical protein
MHSDFSPSRRTKRKSWIMQTADTLGSQVALPGACKEAVMQGDQLLSRGGAEKVLSLPHQASLRMIRF